MKNETDKDRKEAAKQTSSECKDLQCPIHGELSARGKIFEGKVISVHNKRIAIEIERVIYIPKYERYAYKKSKIHARLPDCLNGKIKIGDIVKIQECRPLSKIIHSVVMEKIK